eukprot:s2338_g9.t2
MASVSLPAGYSKDIRVATQPGQAAPVVRTLSFSQQTAPAPQAASISRIPTRVQRAASFHTGAPAPPAHPSVYTAPGSAGRRTIHPATVYPAASHGFVAPGFGRQTSTPVTVPVTQPFGRQTSTPATVTQPFGRQTSTPATVTHAFGRQTSTPAPVPLQQAVPAPVYRRYTSFTLPPGVGLAAAARAATAFHTQPLTQSQDQPSQDEFDVAELQPEVVAAVDAQILEQSIAEDVEPTEDATVQVEEQQQPEVAATVEAETLKETDVEVEEQQQPEVAATVEAETLKQTDVFVFNFGYAKEVHRVSPTQVEEQQQPEVAATVEAETLKETDVEAPQL